MKTFRNVALSLCFLLLLYIGAYAIFARKEMRGKYAFFGGGYSIEWSDWRKLFVPIVALDYWVNVERPLRKRLAGHWKSRESDDFVTLDRDGRCSFRIGRFQHTGKAQFHALSGYSMLIEQDDYLFQFRGKGDSGTAEASVELLHSFGTKLRYGERAWAMLTRVSD